MEFEQRSHYSNRGCLLLLIVIPIGILICSTGVYTATDVVCHSQGENWLPDYPGSEFASERYTFIRAFGIGETERILHTSDSQRNVRTWYNNYTQQQVANGDWRAGVASLNWYLIPDETNGGTTIVLYSQCAALLSLKDISLDN